MPTTNQLLLVVIIAIIISMTLLGAYILLSKIHHRRRELFDLEQRLQAQEQFHTQYLAEIKTVDICPPAMVKQGHHISPHIVIMTPQKQKTKRESLLHKVYGFRTATAPPPFLPHQQAIRPSSVRPPSFLPMKEKAKDLELSPPAYHESHESQTIDKGSDIVTEKI